MSPLLSCAWTTDRMTDYLEGALPPHQLAGVKLHLGFCPRCRAFLASLRNLPGLMRQAFADEAPEAVSGVLGKVMARIQAGEAKVPVHHPSESLCAAFGAGDMDESMKLLLETHLDHCAACRKVHPDHAPSLPSKGDLPLPPRLRDRVLPEADWKWLRHGLRGARVAEIFKDPASRASLLLAYLPAGARFPEHFHSGQEATVILNGWIQDGPYLAGPGDYLQHDGGTEHDPQAEGQDGCWLLARMESDSLHFKGWRRIFG